MELADKLDFPVGTEQERASDKIPCGDWQNTNPFLTHYALGYHTGIDLNLNKPSWDSDAHKPVYSIGNGTVIYAKRVYNWDGKPSSWGNLIVIKHKLVNEETIYSRYGHSEEMFVTVGQDVLCGQHIANVGNAFNRFAYHLHFDIGKTPILESNPPYWPGNNVLGVVNNFTDPIKYLKLYRVITISTTKKYMVKALDNLIVRSKPDKTSLPTSERLKFKGSVFAVIDAVENKYYPLADNTGYVTSEYVKKLYEV